MWNHLTFKHIYTAVANGVTLNILGFVSYGLRSQEISNINVNPREHFFMYQIGHTSNTLQ